MKNFILLSEHPDIQSSQKLLSAAKVCHLKTTTINPYENLLDLTTHSQKSYEDTLVMHRVTGIKNRNFDLSFSGLLQAKGATVVNPLHCFEKLRDKEQQAVFFLQNTIPVIPAIGIRKRITQEEFEIIIEKLAPYQSDQSSPVYILKTIRGNQGVGTNLIVGNKSLRSLLETLWAIRDQEFLIQPFLKEASEYRVLITKEKILGAIKRAPEQNDFRSNAHFGSACKLKNLPEGLIDFASKVFHLSKATYAALDLFRWRDQFMMVEINFVPGFKQMENITGNDIATEIIHAALNEGFTK